jgi:hypothetical protein
MQLHYPTASLGVWGSSGLSPSSGARAALHSIGGSRPHVAAPAVEKASCEPCAGTAAGHGAHPQGTSEEGVPAKHSEGASAQADRPWWSQSAPMSPLANGRGSSGSWQLADGGRRQLSLSPSILPADGSLAVPHISPAGTSHVQQAPLPAGASHTQQSPALAPSLPPHLRVAFRAAPLGARAGPAQAEAPPHSGPPASSPTLLAQSHPSEVPPEPCCTPPPPIFAILPAPWMARPACRGRKCRGAVSLGRRAGAASARFGCVLPVAANPPGQGCAGRRRASGAERGPGPGAQRRGQSRDPGTALQLVRGMRRPRAARRQRARAMRSAASPPGQSAISHAPGAFSRITCTARWCRRCRWTPRRCLRPRVPPPATLRSCPGA